MIVVCDKCRKRYTVEAGQMEHCSCECGGKLSPEDQLPPPPPKPVVQNIEDRCPHCKTSYRIEYWDAGKQMKCPRCRAAFTVKVPANGPARVKSCADCGGQVSMKADHCPHCGAPQWVSPAGAHPGLPQVQVRDFDISLLGMFKLIFCFAGAILVILLLAVAAGIGWDILSQYL